MNHELVYTSSKRGLQAGSKGFCTVAATEGMSKVLSDFLESISGYRHLYPPQSELADRNPTVRSHVGARVGGKQIRVLSRVADAGLDYSNRSNKLAHHLVLSQTQRPTAGPAWMLQQPGTLIDSWQGDPRKLPSREFSLKSAPASSCDYWKQVTGDSGWAGQLVQSYVDQQNAFVIFQPGVDMLRLLAEACSLVAERDRWDVTFTTYFTRFPPNVRCRWRGVVEGSPEAKQARQRTGDLVIDLASPTGHLEGPLVDFARTGKLPESGLDHPPRSPAMPTRRSTAAPYDAGTADLHSPTETQSNRQTSNYSNARPTATVQVGPDQSNGLSPLVVGLGVLLLLAACGLGFVFGRGFDRQPDAAKKTETQNQQPADVITSSVTRPPETVAEPVVPKETAPPPKTKDELAAEAAAEAARKKAANESAEAETIVIANAQPAGGEFSRELSIGMFAHDSSQNDSPPFLLGRWKSQDEGIPNLVVDGKHLNAEPEKDYRGWTISYENSVVANVYFNERKSKLFFRWSQDESTWDAETNRSKLAFQAVRDSSWSIADDKFLVRDRQHSASYLNCSKDAVMTISDASSLVDERLFVKVEPSKPEHRSLYISHIENTWSVVSGGEPIYDYQFVSDVDNETGELHISVQLADIKHGAIIGDLKEQFPDRTDPDYFREMKDAILNVSFRGDVYLSRRGTEYRIASFGQELDLPNEENDKLKRVRVQSINE